MVLPEPNINEQLKSIRGTLDQLAFKTDKSKKFKLPSFSGWKKKIKKNYCVCEIIKLNGDIDFKMLPIENDTATLPINGTFHVATIDYMLHHKGMPVLIIPEWSMIPFDAREHLVKTSEDGMLALPEKIIINKIEQAHAGLDKKKYNMKTIIIIGGIILVGLYMVSKFFPGAGG